MSTSFDSKRWPSPIAGRPPWRSPCPTEATHPARRMSVSFGAAPGGVALARIPKLLLICAALVVSACSSSGKTEASADAGTQTGGEAGADSGQPICTLTEAGTAYECGGGMTWPVCPTNAMTASSSCAAGTAQCMGCQGQGPNQSGMEQAGAGYDCTCQAGVDGGFRWNCIGTEQPCQ